MTETIREREIIESAERLTEAQRGMLLRARREWPNQPPRCYGPGITRKALRDRGLGHGDFCYLTPLGIEVRDHLLTRAAIKSYVSGGEG